MYVDTDVECLRPIDELLEGVTAFAAYEVPGRLCNAVLGAVPGHPAFTRAAELAEVTVGHGTYPEATATTFLTYVLERFEDVTLSGPERFCPTLWDGTLNAGDDARTPLTTGRRVGWGQTGSRLAVPKYCGLVRAMRPTLAELTRMKREAAHLRQKRSQPLARYTRAFVRRFGAEVRDGPFAGMVYTRRGTAMAEDVPAIRWSRALARLSSVARRL